MALFTPVISRLLPIALRAFIAGGSGLGILSSMNVQFMVADPAGRRTGYDSVSRAELSEIPSSRYGVKHTGIIDGRNDRGDSEEGGNGHGSAEDRARDFVAAFASPDHLIDGSYTLRVYGEKSGSFWLSISVYREPVSEDFNIRGTIRAGEIKIYHLIYDDELSVPIRIDTVGSK
jgi:hypothetical protein